jgi:cytoskeletal protein RodZ
MALGQATEPQQQQQPTTTNPQGDTSQTQPAAPAKGKKSNPAQEPNKPQAKPESGTTVRGQTNVQSHEGHNANVNRDDTGTRSSTSTSQTNVNTNTNTRVNVTEFRQRHSEVFSLGRHPKEFFIQKFGEKHVRMIGQTYFVFVDGCWVAVDVDGSTYTERVICAGDPEYIVVD